LFFFGTAICAANKRIAGTYNGIDLIDRDQRWTDKAHDPRKSLNHLDRIVLTDESERFYRFSLQVDALQPGVRNTVTIEVFRNQQYECGHYVAMPAGLLKVQTRQRPHKQTSQLCDQIARPVPTSVRDVEQFLVNTQLRRDPEDEMIVLHLAVVHSHLKRIQETERNRCPEVSYADEIEEDEPAIKVPYAATQLANKVGLPVTCGTNDDLAERFVRWVGIAGLSFEVIDKIVEPILVERRHIVRRIPPDAPELPRPVEIN
jgi:hypothetical protein